MKALTSDVGDLNRRLKTVQVAFGANVVFCKSDRAGRRKALLAAFTRVLALTDKQFRFFRVDGTSYQWGGKNAARTFATIEKKLARPGSYSEYAFFCANEDPSAAPAVCSVYAQPNYTTSSEASATFGFALPVQFWEARRDEVAALFHEACVSLDAEQAHAGLTIVDRAHYYFDGERLLDRPRAREVAKLLNAHPGLDLHHVDAMGLQLVDYEARYGEQATGDVAWGLRWPAWSTYLASKWVKQLGGASLAPALSAGSVKRGKSGLLVVSGTPSLDGRSLRKLGKATRTLRMRTDFRPGHAFLAELTRDRANEWVKRFD